jgi:cytoskeletal protein RodZ
VKYILDSIGSLLKETRETSGVSISEASEDLNIKENFLLNIEDGKIGCFKDIFELKDYITNYAKYLGLDSSKLVDEFNEYMFEYTSKIPVKEIERQAKIQAKEETNKVVSPYTKKPRKYSKNHYIAVYLIILLLVILAIVWSIKQITVDNHITNEISYVRF